MAEPTKDELLEAADEAGVEVPASATKKEIEVALQGATGVAPVEEVDYDEGLVAPDGHVTRDPEDPPAPATPEEGVSVFENTDE